MTSNVSQLPKFSGEPVRRREDPKLITGLGSYVDDVKLPRMLHMSIVRSTRPHARLRRLDAAAAMEAPGVGLVMTGSEARAWGGPLPIPTNPEPRYPLANETVRFVGDAIAAVVADDRYLSSDAAELVEIEYEDLPPVVDARQALEPDSPILYPGLGTNLAASIPMGDKDAVEAAFREADVTISQRMVNHRLIPNAIEPRGVVASYDPGMETLTLWTSTQMPHGVRNMVAQAVGLPDHNVRVIAPDVGGAFGSKGNIYAEEILTALASIHLRRPVKWIEQRTENYQATTHGRDIHADLEIAARSDGRITALRARLLADIGAYQQLLTAGVPTLTALMLGGVYKIPVIYAEISEVYTNKTPTDSYRGAGRPEGIYFVERGMDILAHKLGMDPAEVRRRNFIEASAFPYQTAMGMHYDSGNYEPALDMALQAVDYEGLRHRQAELREQGRYLGIGISAYVELCGVGPSSIIHGGGWEAGTVRVERSGKVTVTSGTSPHGQGTVTTLAQLTADGLGVPIEDVTVIHGDTAQVPFGIGTFGSRGLAVGGSAVLMSIEKVKAKAKQFAGHLLEALPQDLVYDNGHVYVQGHPDKAMTIQEIGAAAWNAAQLPPDTEPGLEFTSYFEPTNMTFPFGAHIAIVEVDPETGKVDLQRFVAVDDCGNVINPMILEGQIHGGIAQGVGQALYEEAVYGEDGQLITGSLMDYNVPKADQLPSYELHRTVTPTPVNPIGAKGAGEAGTIGSTPAVVNAVVDALSPFGVDHIDMMLRPEKLWRIMQGGRQ